jgi:hypothetical protein
MASYNYTFVSGDTVTPTKLNSARTVSDIVNADIASGAAIVGTKIAPAFGAQDITLSTADRSITNTGNFALSFGTNNTARVTIPAAGGISIATGAPDRIGMDFSNNAVSTLNFGSPNSGDGNFQVQYDRVGGSFRFIGGSTGSQAERMRIDASGSVLIGSTSSRAIGVPNPQTLQVEASLGVGIVANRNDAVGGILSLGKSRATTAGGTTIVQDNDTYGEIRFAGANGSNLQNYGASIGAFVDGTPGASDMPGRLVFYTTPDGSVNPQERLRITNAGLIGINNNSPAFRLDVTGDINCSEAYGVDGVQVVSNRRTGWTAATGTATRTTFATSTVTLPQLAERVKALIDDLSAHGLIGT